MTVQFAGLPRSIRVDNTGTRDASRGIRNALEALAETRQDYDSYAAGRTKRLVLPDGKYRIDEPISFDPDVAVDFAGEAFFGAELVNNTGGDWIIDSRGLTVGTNLGIRNLLLVGGGINLWERWRGELIVTGVKVTESPSWGINLGDGAENETGGADLGPVWWTINNCQFYHCGTGGASGALGINCSTMLIGEVYRNRFIRNYGPSIEVNGPGVWIDMNDFQQVDRTYRGNSHIWFRALHDAAAHVVVSRNRFGRESDAEYQTPLTQIEIGEDSGAVNGIGNYFIRDNVFMGAAAPGATEADSVLLIHEKPSNVALLPNYINMQYRTVIDQAWVANPASPTPTESQDRNCVIYRQHVAPTTTNDITVDNGDGTLVGAGSAIGWQTSTVS